MFQDKPEVVQNDNVIFEVTIIDGSTGFDLSPSYSYKLVSLKPSGKSVLRDGSIDGSIIRFNLGTSEMMELGTITATVQIFEGSERISSSQFQYIVIQDISFNGTISADNTSLVVVNESIMTDAINKSNKASTDSTTALLQSMGLTDHNTSYVYNADGTVQSVTEKDTSGNTVRVDTYSYNASGWVTKCVTNVNGKTYTTVYTYAANGTISGITNTIS
jgi:hypothetical protein